MAKGSCLCGSIQFEVVDPLPAAAACHCTSCRKHSGHYEASVDVPRSSLTITGEDSIQWYQSSGKARRGFCRSCGSSLFWQPLKHDWIGVSMGAFDEPTHSKIEKHFFVANKGDYYEIPGGAAQFPTHP